MLHLNSQQYIYIYVWAFAAVNLAWYVTWSYLGHYTSHLIGMAAFLTWLCLHLGFAFVLAAGAPDQDFYDMGKDNLTKATVCMMNFWVIDNMTWWAWAQILVTMDTDA